MIPTLRSVLVPILLMCASIASAQLDVFPRFSDYENATGRSYPQAEFKRWSGKENTTLTFKVAGAEDLEIECAGIWGFIYKSNLFRITTDSKYLEGKGAAQIGTPYVVMYLGEVVLYEYGLNLLDAMKKERDRAIVQGMCGTLSKDLGSPMAMVPCYPAKWTDERLLELLGEHEDLAELKQEFLAYRGDRGSPLGGGFFGLDWVRNLLRNRQRDREREQQEGK